MSEESEKIFAAAIEKLGSAVEKLSEKLDSISAAPVKKPEDSNRLSRSQVAKKFGKSTKTIKRWVDYDGFPEIKGDSGQPCYDLKAIELWEKRRTNKVS